MRYAQKICFIIVSGFLFLYIGGCVASQKNVEGENNSSAIMDSTVPQNSAPK
ncbi:hypothetical protein HY745_11220 [Candidatus Desantisbacteria bacterium]|nr:hypothetical protein [Candidatus Desantisbacteria bacterium]